MHLLELPYFIIKMNAMLSFHDIVFYLIIMRYLRTTYVSCCGSYFVLYLQRQKHQIAVYYQEINVTSEALNKEFNAKLQGITLVLSYNI